jgi:hypothetical protein
MNDDVLEILSLLARKGDYSVNPRKIPGLKTEVFPVSLDCWSYEKRFALQWVLLAVISGCNSSLDGETDRGMEDSLNNSVRFCRISA